MTQENEHDRIVVLLDVLADLKAAADAARMAKQEAIATEMAKYPELQKALQDIEVELGGRAAIALDNAAQVEEQIKREVVARQQSVKGNRMHAVFNQGRLSWDNRGMNEYARDHPDVLKFRQIGEPYVSMRFVTNPKEDA